MSDCYTKHNMAKKILILLGHPDSDTFSGALVERYQQAAVAADHEVRRLDIGTMDFNPVLHKGYKELQALEPDLIEFQTAVEWADHLVLVYPCWWCAMPAKLKGLFDRVWLPNFAFTYKPGAKEATPLLKGRTARIIITIGQDAPFQHWWKYGDYTNEVQHSIFGSAGIRASVKALGPCERVGGATREKWLDAVAALGHSGT